MQDKEADSKKGNTFLSTECPLPIFKEPFVIEFDFILGSEASKDGEPEAKVSKVEDESPKQPSEKASGLTDESVEQLGRPTRRSKN